jgi:hypothetical protein
MRMRKRELAMQMQTSELAIDRCDGFCLISECENGFALPALQMAILYPNLFVESSIVFGQFTCNMAQFYSNLKLWFEIAIHSCSNSKVT